MGDIIHDIVPWRGPIEVGWTIPSSDGGFGPPQSIVNDIRGFWKPYVPLVCARVFVGPDGEKHTFRYHVLGRWRESPDPAYPDFGRIIKGLDRPRNFPFKGGVIYEQRTISASWPDQSSQRGCLTPDIPLAYPDQPLPPGFANVYEFVTEPPTKMEWERTRDWIERSIHFTLKVAGTIESKLAALDAQKRAADAKEEKRIDDDADYKFKQHYSEFRRAVDEGRFLPLPRPYEPKQYAFLPRRKRGIIEV